MHLNGQNGKMSFEGKTCRKCANGLMIYDSEHMIHDCIYYIVRH